MQPSYTRQPGREPFFSLGEAVLERVRSVAQRITERVRRVTGEAQSEAQAPPEDHPLPGDVVRGPVDAAWGEERRRQPGE